MVFFLIGCFSFGGPSVFRIDRWLTNVSEKREWHNAPFST